MWTNWILVKVTLFLSGSTTESDYFFKYLPGAVYKDIRTLFIQQVSSFKFSRNELKPTAAGAKKREVNLKTDVMILYAYGALR